MKFFKVDFNRFVEHRANYYDLDWNLLPFGEVGLAPDPNHIEAKPENFDKMVEIATKLSTGHEVIRIDLYNVRGKIYFGEMTFYPASGMGRFTEDEWDETLGALIKL